MKLNSKFFQHPLTVTLFGLLCCALWGSATPFIKLGYEYVLPEKDVPSTILFAGIRFFLAGILTVIIFSAGRRKILYPKAKSWWMVALVGLFQTVIQYIFFYVGLANTSGVKGTIASGSSTFFAILISSLVFRQEKLTVKKIIACILGFAGIITVNLSGLIGDGSVAFTMNFLGDGFVILSAVSLGVSSTLIKLFSKDEDPVTISGYQFILGGAVMIILALCLGGKVDLTNIAGVGILIYLSFLSAVAYSLWGLLLKYNPVSKVSIFSFTTPIFGVILSELMLTEQGGVDLINLFLALALVCAGILTLNLNPELLKLRFKKATSSPESNCEESVDE